MAQKQKAKTAIKKFRFVPYDCTSKAKLRETMMDGKKEEKIPVAKSKPSAAKKKRRHKPKDFPKVSVDPLLLQCLIAHEL